MPRMIAIFAALGLAACGGTAAGGNDAATDAGPDSSVDAGTDASADASLDAAMFDGGIDAGSDGGSDGGMFDGGLDAGLDGGADAGSDATMFETCDIDSCSMRGTCVNTTGVVVCICDPPFAGDDCSECEDGLQDNDDNGVCAPACDVDSCSGNGVCDDSSGAIVCDCDDAFDGEVCDECAVGLAGEACDECAEGFSGDNCEYLHVHSLDLPDNANWKTLQDVPYAEGTMLPTAFDRVVYELQLDDDSVRVEMDAFTDEPGKLGVPVDWRWDQNITNLSIESTAGGLPTVNDVSGGSMEFWHHCARSEPGNNDADDTPHADQPDCYGSMQVHYLGGTVFAYNRWSSNNNYDDLGIGDAPDANTDWTNQRNADTYLSKHLDVRARLIKSCSGSTCGNGDCDDSSGVAVCSCDEGYAGARCNSCAEGYNDLDHDGVCEVGCGEGSCDGLEKAVGLATGVHNFALLSGTTPLYVDGDYDAGAWILVGRGREGWDFDDERGMGQASSIKDGIGTNAAFTPKYLAGELVRGMIDNTLGGTIDLTDVEIRIKRAANRFGTKYQEVLWLHQSQPDWSWQFDVRNGQVLMTVEDSIFGAGGTFLGNTRDVQPGNDHRRVFTWRWDRHSYQSGFSYGSSVTTGSSDSGNFLWEASNENLALPYTEVYVRLPRCQEDTCSGHGQCEDAGGLPTCTCDEMYAGADCSDCDAGFQDNDDDGVCEAACDALSCAGDQGCSDASGTVQCFPVMGTSCLDILTNDPMAADGVYAIDPDGGGVNPPLAVECDMTGGGWTVIAFETFTNGQAVGWSDDRVDTESTCAAEFGPMLGGFDVFGNNVTSTKVFDLGGVAHTEATVSLDYLVIDSWDNENAVVRVDGMEIFNQTFTHSGSSNVCGGSWGDVGPVPVSANLMHMANSIEVEVTSTVNQSANDESFGVQNVRVSVR